jgi:hypothetical protein
MLVAVMVVGTFGFMVIEHLSPVDAFYFSIVTITTVGYGDIHPATPAGKVLTVILIVMGVGTFLGVVANATEMMLNRRERRVRLQKLNMVIGVFFSEVGIELLGVFAHSDPNLDQIGEYLIVTASWNDQDFLRAGRALNKYAYGIEGEKVDFGTMRRFLLQKREFLVNLLENPTLLEHESFTQLLWAVFHLTEELDYRRDTSRLIETDKAHLVGDARRVYRLLVDQWLDYMKHLKHHYPYLYSLAVRTNPFDKKASPVVK